MWVWVVGIGKKEEEICVVSGGFVMGFVSSILGLFGFGVGISIGLLVGYFFFIYFESSDVKVSLSS